MTTGAVQGLTLLTISGIVLLLAALYFGLRLLSMAAGKDKNQTQTQSHVAVPTPRPPTIIRRPAVGQREYAGMTAQALLQILKQTPGSIVSRLTAAKQYQGKWVNTNRVVHSIEAHALVLEGGSIRARFAQPTRGLPVRPGDRVEVHGIFTGLDFHGVVVLDRSELRGVEQ